MNDLLPAEVEWRVRVFDSLSFPTLIMNPDRRSNRPTVYFCKNTV